MPADSLPRAAALGGAAAVLVLASLTLLSAVAALSLAPSGVRGAPADWARAAMALLALAVHAPVRVAVDGNLGGLATGGLTSSFTVTPLALTAVLWSGVYVMARRRGLGPPDGRPAQLITLSTAAAGVFALAAAAGALMAEGPITLGENSLTTAVSSSIGPAPAATALWAFAFVCPAMAAGLLSRHARVRGEAGFRAYLLSRIGPWRDDLAHAAVLSVAVIVVAAVAGVALGASQVLQALLEGSGPAASGTEPDAEAGAGDLRSSLGVLVVAVAFLPNLLVLAGGAVMGATVGVEGGGNGTVPGLPNGETGGLSIERGYGLLTGGVPVVAYLCVPLLMAVVILVGVRYAMRDVPDSSPTTRWWHFPAAFAALWLGLGIVTGMSADVEGRAGVLRLDAEAVGAASAGLGLPSLAIAAFAWAAASRVLGRRVAPALAGALPRVVARLAGSSAHPQWQLLLATEVERTGHRQPEPLYRAGEALARGVRPQFPPLGPRPGLARTIRAGSAAAPGLALLALIGYPVVSATAFGPERTVHAYFDAVRSGDAERALQHVLPASLQDVDRTLLTSGVLGEAGVEARIGDVAREGDAAQVTAEVTGAGTATFRLERDGRIAGLFPRWRLQSPFSLLEINVDDGGLPVETSARVNGVTVPATDAGVAVFPGRYTVDIPVDYPLTAAERQVTASGSDVETVDVTVGLDGDVVGQAQEEVNEYVDQCTRSSAAAPAGCPFSYWSSTLATADWQVVSYPRITVVPAWDGTSMEVSTEEPGEVHLSGSDAGLFGTTDVDYEESVWVSGALVADPGTRTVTFVPSS